MIFFWLYHIINRSKLKSSNGFAIPPPCVCGAFVCLSFNFVSVFLASRQIWTAFFSIWLEVCVKHQFPIDMDCIPFRLSASSPASTQTQQLNGIDWPHSFVTYGNTQPQKQLQSLSTPTDLFVYTHKSLDKFSDNEFFSAKYDSLTKIKATEDYSID